MFFKFFYTLCNCVLLRSDFQGSLDDPVWYEYHLNHSFLLLLWAALYCKIHIFIHFPLHVEFYCIVLDFASRKRKWRLLMYIVLSYLHIGALCFCWENLTLNTSFSIWYVLLLNRVCPLSSPLQGECSIGLCFHLRPVGFFSAVIIFCP